MPVPLTDVRAEFVNRRLDPGQITDGAFTVRCPLCMTQGRDGRVRVSVGDDHQSQYVCDSGCNEPEVIGALFEMPERPAFDPPAWLVGEPLDLLSDPGEPLATVPGFPFVHPGTSIVIVGPTGGGRSSLAQACAYDAAHAGVRVAFLGGEVSPAEFVQRMRVIAERRDDPVTPELRDQLRVIQYLSLAETIGHAQQDPGLWARGVAHLYDVVILDPLADVAAALGLDFDKVNRDYVDFFVKLVNPLCLAGVAVVLLDNIGHGDHAQRRAKGASGKSDKAHLTAWCKTGPGGDSLILTMEKVRPIRSPLRRGTQFTFGRDTQRIERAAQTDTTGPFRRTVLMERISRALETEPGLTRRVITHDPDRAKGNKDEKGKALNDLIGDGYVREDTDGAYVTHHVIRPYRQPADTAEHETGPTGGPNDPDENRPQGQPLDFGALEPKNASGPTGPKAAPRWPQGTGPEYGPSGPPGKTLGGWGRSGNGATPSDELRNTYGDGTP